MVSHTDPAGFAAAMAKGASALGQAHDGTHHSLSQPLMRRYEISALTPDGQEVSATRGLIAEPLIDEAFTAFARGTLFTTTEGPVAVEDLYPGMMLDTADAGPQRLLWVGSTLLAPPRGPEPPETPLLTRISADSLGIGRPMPDLVLGPRARMLVRYPGCATVLNSDAAFAPASSFIDGVAFVGLNVVQPTRVYHLALASQHILLANGVEVESYHPGENVLPLMNRDSLGRFLSLFPHLQSHTGFGTMVLPRLTTFEAERLSAA
ncbi:iron-regulated protein frpC [Rhodovulum sp. P5]|uniref:Hint domain-containing protein n=1 Tax=Rhodovulum sp. P5 TaxID=1564506 RepID=UPI0009C39175|nr:Hint domain-containing protein [Rhodovulum sp. P5]ARE40268.1 iron-regulated protein frpC [Rhodovulum sp. P5]